MSLAAKVKKKLISLYQQDLDRLKTLATKAGLKESTYIRKLINEAWKKKKGGWHE